MAGSLSLHHEPFWSRPGFVWAAIATYLTLHFAVRLTFWPTLGYDDAEQALFSQQFEWSYRFRAPPSFTWVLLGLNRIAGPNVLTLSILRYLLLAVIFSFAYLSARLLLNDNRLSALAVYGFSAVYVTGYYSHHDLTHTTAMTAGLAVCWYLCLRLLDEQSIRLYAAFGLAAGLALISKWNFALFLLAIFIVVLLQPVLRQKVLFNRGILVAAAIALVVAGPTIVSTAYYGPQGNDDVSNVLGVEDEFSIGERIEAVGNLTLYLFTYPQPFLIIMLICFWRFMRRDKTAAMFKWRGELSATQTATLITVVAIGLHYAIAITTGADNLNERLLQPALFLVPVLVFGAVDGRDISDRSLGQYAGILLAVAMFAMGGRFVVNAFEPESCRTCRSHLPVEELAANITKDGFSGYGTIVTTGHHIAGNLRMMFPKARVVDTDFPLRYWSNSPIPSGDCLLVSERFEGVNGFRTDFAKQREFIRKQLSGEAPNLAERRELELFLLGSTQRTKHFAYILQPGGTGACK